MKHGAWPQAFGYRFETLDRTIVISGDTAPTEAIVDNCRGCDVLIHEVYSDAGLAGRPPEWQKYHARYHTSATALGDIARRAQPGLLVLTHQLVWGSNRETLMREVQTAYPGKCVYGNDLDIF